MSEKPVFTPRQHLDSLIEAVKGSYFNSPDPAHHAVAGMFTACQERIDYLYKRIGELEDNNARLLSENAFLHERVENLTKPKE